MGHGGGKGDTRAGARSHLYIPLSYIPTARARRRVSYDYRLGAAAASGRFRCSVPPARSGASDWYVAPQRVCGAGARAGVHRILSGRRRRAAAGRAARAALSPAAELLAARVRGALRLRPDAGPR